MWEVLFEDRFKLEFNQLPNDVKKGLAVQAKLLAQVGPMLGRPRVDTLKGSRFSNMKELRFDAADGGWRAAFAFDPNRRAIVLVAADKSGVSEARFYRNLIEKADQRFAEHLTDLTKE